MKIGFKLKNKRDSKKITQQEVANFLEVSHRTYSNFESNKTSPSVEQLSKLAQFLEFDLLEWLEEQGFVFNQYNKKGSNNGIVNYNSDTKLIEQLEKRIKIQEDYIELLKTRLDS